MWSHFMGCFPRESHIPHVFALQTLPLDHRSTNVQVIGLVLTKPKL